MRERKGEEGGRKREIERERERDREREREREGNEGERRIKIGMCDKFHRQTRGRKWDRRRNIR
jgi:hypothetical protein